MNSKYFTLSVSVILFLNKGAHGQVRNPQNRIAALEGKLDQLLSLSNAQQETIEALEASASAQDEIINKLQNTVNGQKALLDAQNKTIYDQGATIQSIEAGASAQRETLNNLQNTVNNQESRLQIQSKAMDDYLSRIRSLEAIATVQNETIEEIQNTVARQEVLIDGKNDTIKELSATIQSLGALASSQNERINGLQSTVNGQRALLEVQGNEIKMLQDKDAKLNADLSAFNDNCTSKISAMKSQVEGLIDEFVDEVQLNAAKSALEARIDTIAALGSVSTNNSTAGANHTILDAEIFRSLTGQLATLQSNSPFNCTIDKGGKKNCVSDEQVSMLVQGPLQVGNFGSNSARPTQNETSPEEQTKFDVILISPGGAKLNVVKAVKSITGLGLKEAKAIVDNAPTAVKEGVSKEEAESLKMSLEGAGAEVEIK